MSQSFARQAAVYVDPVAGIDYAAGTVGAPLKTWAEIRRRIGAGGLFKQATTINLVNPLPSTDPMLVDFGVDTPSTSSANGLTITGPYADVGATGTVGTARVRNPSTRVYNGITSSTGGFNWIPYAVSDRIITGTGGGINGARGWVVSDDGSALATVTTFLPQAGFPEATITNGDTYKFTQLMRVDSAQFRPPRGGLNVKGFVFTGLMAVARPGTYAVLFTECSFETAFTLFSPAGFPVFVNCRYQTANSNYVFDGTGASFSGGLYISTGLYSGGGQGMLFHGGCDGIITAGMFFKLTGVGVQNGGYCNIIDAMWAGGCRDYTGIRVYSHGRVVVQTISGFVTGINAPYGMQLDNSANVMFGGASILNLIGDAGLGGNDVLVAQQGTLTWAEIKSGSAYNIGGAHVWIGSQIG